jgi:hypothetical protein
MPKKQTQRGCALSKKRRKNHNKSAKQRGGDLHKMYSINNLTQDPQRMMTVDRGVIQTGGSYKKHKHSRKYLKHGGMNYSMINNATYNTMTPLIANNQSTMNTNIRVPAMV